MKKTDNPSQVKVTKEFNVSQQKVFDAWLNTEMIGRWMFGRGVRDEEIISLESNPEIGGTFSFVVRRGEDVINHLGRYLEIDRPHRLVFTWGVESESEEESVVSIGISPIKSGCRLTLIHELDPKWADYADRTKEGWNTMLDKLKTII